MSSSSFLRRQESLFDARASFFKSFPPKAGMTRGESSNPILRVMFSIPLPLSKSPAMVRPMKNERTLAEKFMWLGVIAVAIAGLYALVPVIGRTPQLKSLNVMQHFFDVALVIHVDLSVLMWSFSMICMGAALLMERFPGRWLYWQNAGFWCMAVATALMAFSPLGAWEPVKSNYIPVLHNGMFLLSLGLLFSGLIATLLPCVVTFIQPRNYRTLDAVDLAWVCASAIVMVGLVGYLLSAYALPPGLERLEHYERLFWAGGHIMQFSFTALVVGAWLVLVRSLGGGVPNRTLSLYVYGIILLGALVSLAGFALHSFEDSAFMAFQTRIMIEWSGIGPTLMAGVVIYFMVRRSKFARENRAYGSALISSLVLFFFGGVLGLMISGQNVTIPAHYHGMITGITQALIGLAYVMLPRFGYQPVGNTRLAFWQPIVYGIGQLMHIGGLAYCGGYGILRKTAGGFEHLAPDIKVALGIFGLGGLLAITGGILFVIVMLRAKKMASASHHAPVV